MLQIFLAHANEDQAAVTGLYHRLKESGYQPWLDKVDLLPGQNWRAEIPRAIKESQVFMACLSQQSVAKQGYVQREFRMALNAYADKPPGSIYLIPVRLDDCKIPELRQEEYGINMRDIQWVDLFAEDGYERLLKTLAHGFPDSHQQAAAAPMPELITEKLGGEVELEMVRIPSGRFWMGSPESELERLDREGPQHKVDVPSFYLGKYPVTQRQWLAVSLLDDVDIALKPDPSSFKGADRPVEQVSWYEAVEFCQRLSRHTGRDYRLPSEAEWEYACRAGTTTPFYYGSTLSSDLANYDANHVYSNEVKGTYRKQTTDVGSFPVNDFGLHDMHGNVWEWCHDCWHRNYKGAPIDGSAWINKWNIAKRIIRGGSWAFYPRFCRSAYRRYSLFYVANFTVGFRVSCSAPKT